MSPVALATAPVAELLATTADRIAARKPGGISIRDLAVALLMTAAGDSDLAQHGMHEIADHLVNDLAGWPPYSTDAKTVTNWLYSQNHDQVAATLRAAAHDLNTRA